MMGDREENAQFTRRQYLGVVGSATAVMIGASGAAAAEENGYGTSGYGTGPYGGAEEEQSDGGDEDAVPTIEYLSGEDVSNPKNPHVDAELNWRATIDNSELQTASLTLSDADGELESWTYDLSDQTAEATETTRVKQGARRNATEYTVELVVRSSHGETDTQTTQFTSQ